MARALVGLRARAGGERVVQVDHLARDAVALLAQEVGGDIDDAAVRTGISASTETAWHPYKIFLKWGSHRRPLTAPAA